MNLEKLLAQNMLRFGTKNINESQLRKFLLEFHDWSSDGKKNWEDANIDDIIKFISEKDAGKPYTNYSVYAPIIQWFKENGKGRKKDAVRQSLKVWAGDINEGIPKPPAGSEEDYKDLQKYNLNKYITIATGRLEDAEAGKWATTNKTEMVTALKSYINLLNAIHNKVALSSTKAKALSDFNVTLASGTATPSDINDIRDSTWETIEKSSDKNVRTGYITDDLRGVLMSSALKQVSEKLEDPAFADGVGAKDKSIASVVNAASNITISKSKSSITAYQSKDVETVVQAGKPVPVFTTLQFQYPAAGASDEERLNESISYFGDDKSTPEAIIVDKIKADVAKINAQLVQLRNALDADNKPAFQSIKVLSITTMAASSTSWVNSGYQGIATSKNLINVTVGKGSDMSVTGQYKDPKTGQLTAVKVGTELPQASVKDTKRNVPLAKDRCKNLLSVLRTQLQQSTVGIALKSDGGSYLEQPGIELPNNGPKWTSVGGKDLISNATIGIGDYGPLFQAAYKNNSAITPQQFYGIRNDAAAANASRLLGKTVTAADLKTEYEATYKKYRYSNVYFSVIIECIPTAPAVPEDLKEKEFILSTAGEYEISLEWSTAAKRFWKRIRSKFKDMDWFSKFNFQFGSDTTSEGAKLTKPGGQSCPQF
jgi:hypothetical protein